MKLIMNEDELRQKYDLQAWDGDKDGSYMEQYLDHQLGDLVRVGVTHKLDIILIDKKTFNATIDKNVDVAALKVRREERIASDYGEDYLEFYHDNFIEVFNTLEIDYNRNKDQLYVNAYDYIFDYLDIP